MKATCRGVGWIKGRRSVAQLHSGSALGVVMMLAALLMAVTGAYAATTVEIIKDINPTGFSKPIILDTVAWNGMVYFPADDGVHGFELWRTDGTADGTVVVKEINPSGSAFPSDFEYPYYPWFAVFNGALYFEANDGVHGAELWRTDGTAAGTVMVKDINPSGSSYPWRLTPIDGVLYFAASDGVHGAELWKSDGTSAGTVMVKDIRPSGESLPDMFYGYNGAVYFVANDGTHGEELWKTNGTAAGTVLLKDINTTSYAGIFGVKTLGGLMYFFATDTVHGRSLWKSDGTTAGTEWVKQVDISVSGLSLMSGRLYFSNSSSGPEEELWTSDGTYAGTVLLKDINPHGSSYPSIEIITNGTMYMYADDGTHHRQWWKSDGTGPGTALVKIINPGGDATDNAITGAPSAAVRNWVFFRADDGTHGSELWQSDGTEDGTFLVADINPTDDSLPESLTPLGDSLIFWARDGTHGGEPWICRPDFVPVVESITRVGASTTDDKTVQFTVTFSEDVFGVDKLDFALLRGSGLTGATIASVSGTGAVYTVTVAGIGGQGTLRLDLVDDDTIMDATHQPLGGPGLVNGDFRTGESFQIVTQLPLTSWPAALALLLAGGLALRMTRQNHRSQAG